MRCEYADGSWEYYGFDFSLYVSEMCHFLMFILDAIFRGIFFLIFKAIVWLVK